MLGKNSLGQSAFQFIKGVQWSRGQDSKGHWSSSTPTLTNYVFRVCLALCTSNFHAETGLYYTPLFQLREIVTFPS